MSPLAATLSAQRERWRRWRGASIDLLYPPACLRCAAALGSPHGEILLCHDCRQQLVDGAPHCDRCGAGMPAAAGTRVDCGQCARRGWRFQFERVVRLGKYDGPLREVVLQMKHQSCLPLAIAVGGLLAQRGADRLGGAGLDAVVPVPMHWLRRAWRGVNSPDILARQLADHLRLPLADHLLRRRRLARTQSSLSPSARLENVRGVFRAREHRDLVGARLLLVDDVLTTGATCHEAAKELRRAGAASVTVAIVARTET